MSLNFGVRQAQRSNLPIRLLVEGESKGGKSLTMLQVALHLADEQGTPRNLVGVIDAEPKGNRHDDGSLMMMCETYIDSRCNCGQCNRLEMVIDGFQVLELPDEGHNPDDFGRALQAMSKAGIEILLIDGITPEWEWVLRQVDKFRDWGQAKAPHIKFLRDIREYPGHVIVSCRSKQKHKPEGKEKVTSLGILPIQDPQIHFSFDLCMLIQNLGQVGHIAARSMFMAGQEVSRPGLDFARELLRYSRNPQYAEERVARMTNAAEQSAKAVPPSEAKRSMRRGKPSGNGGGNGAGWIPPTDSAIVDLDPIQHELASVVLSLELLTRVNGVDVVLEQIADGMKRAKGDQWSGLLEFAKARLEQANQIAVALAKQNEDPEPAPEVGIGLAKQDKELGDWRCPRCSVAQNDAAESFEFEGVIVCAGCFGEVAQKQAEKAGEQSKGARFGAPNEIATGPA